MSNIKIPGNIGKTGLDFQEKRGRWFNRAIDINLNIILKLVKKYFRRIIEHA